MAAQMTGADAQALEQAAAELRTAADELESYSTGLTSVLGSVQWLGPIAGWFLDKWSGTHRVRLTSTAEFVRDMAVTLDANAADQRTTSDGDGGGGRPGGNDPGDGGDDSGDDNDGEAPEILDELSDLLESLGIVLSAAELAELAEILDGLPTEDVKDFLKAVENSPILDFIDAAGTVLDIGGFVTDAITDFVENPDLPLEERLIHAGVESALKFGASEGIDKALTALGTAIGGPAGFVLGKGAGFVADLLFSAADDAFGITDTAADVLTEFITDPVGSLEALGDYGVELISDLGGEAVELFTDLGGEAAELFGDIHDTIKGDGVPYLPGF